MRLNFDRIMRGTLLAIAIFSFGCLVNGAAAQPSNVQSSAPLQASSGAMVNVQRNVYAAGGQVRPAGPVAGDFAAAGARIVLDQPVGGDAALIGGSVDVRAAVGDDLRAVGGDIGIESSVGGELFASGGNITVARAANVAGSASVYGGNIDIEGRVGGGLTAHGQKIKINGEVRGDVHLAAASIELGPLARIGGALSYASASELKKAEGATIAGQVKREEAPAAGAQQRHPERGIWIERHGTFSQGTSWAGSVFFYVSLLACTAVLLAVAPRFAVHTSERIRRTPWVAMAVGLGAVFAVPFLAVLLFVTLLGIPLGIIVLSLYPVLLLAGFVVGVLFIARLLPPLLRQPAPTVFMRNFAYVALALLLLLLVGHLPFAGGLLVGLVSLAGIGACVMELHNRRKGPSAGVPSTPPPALPSAATQAEAKGA
jgi:hypothetical protein